LQSCCTESRGWQLICWMESKDKVMTGDKAKRCQAKK